MMLAPVAALLGGVPIERRPAGDASPASRFFLRLLTRSVLPPLYAREECGDSRVFRKRAGAMKHPEGAAYNLTTPAREHGP